MNSLTLDESIDQILRKDSRFPRDAYEFVREALDFTVKQRKKHGETSLRHVSGKELLDSVRKYALHQYGPLAFTLLAYWNLHRGEDIGEVVFNLVDASVLRVSETDSREDFKGSYDFEEAFLRPFEPEHPIDPPLIRRAGKLGTSKST